MKRLINFVLPVQTCNFHCHYCYIGQEGRFNGGMGHLQYSPQHIQRAMTKERLGGICHINMCGLGETLLPEYAADLCRRMLENGHFVSIVTNGTITERIKELLAFPEDYRQRMFFKFSFHWLELKRTNMLDVFWENVQRVKNARGAFSIELTVNDACAEHVGEIQKSCMEHAGAFCHVIESRNNNDGFSRLTKLAEEDHLRIWDMFGSPLFEFQKKHWMVKRKEFCYAGDWAVSLNVESGWMMPCFAGGAALQNLFEDITEPVHFMAVGNQCQWRHCYAGHILLSSGVIPELDTPSYAQFRDRKDQNGCHWLNASIRSFFGSKLAGENSCYRKEKQQWINALNRIIYEGRYPSEEETKCLAEYVKENLQSRRIRSAAVFGSEENMGWMNWVLRLAGIRVKYGLIITQHQEKSIKNQVKSQVKYLLKNIAYRKTEPLLLLAEDRRPHVDAMIVCGADGILKVKNNIEEDFPLVVWNELVF